MKAYFVHSRDKNEDKIFIPFTQYCVSVTPEQFEKFISVTPDFSRWKGEKCTDIKPEDFGIVVAIREDGEDVCILQKDLWYERMGEYSQPM
jgi:hypothetical protein